MLPWQQHLLHYNINFEPRKILSAKNLLGYFCYVQFSIVLLAAQVNRKIEIAVEFSGPVMIKLSCVFTCKLKN